MSDATLEERLSALEKQVAHLIDRLVSPATRSDWRSTVGIFAGDALMREIDEEGRKIRDADREQARGDHS